MVVIFYKGDKRINLGLSLGSRGAALPPSLHVPKFENKQDQANGQYLLLVVQVGCLLRLAPVA